LVVLSRLAGRIGGSDLEQHQWDKHCGRDCSQPDTKHLLSHFPSFVRIGFVADVTCLGMPCWRNVGEPLVLEVKRPGTISWHRRAVEAALDQARRYEAEQKVGAVAVSDAHMPYAADVVAGGLRDRVLGVRTLSSTEPLTAQAITTVPGISPFSAAVH
jgi:hypothetical protein